MPKSDHSHGPWNYDGHESRTIVGVRSWGVECPTICDVLDTTEGLEGDCPQADANGRLIAEAPAMYSVLVMLMDGRTNDARYYARDILDRLHGEQEVKPKEAE